MLTWYSLLKTLHVSLAILSIAGFVARWLGMAGGAGWVQARFARIAPHAVDTLFLLSAIALPVEIRQAPITHDWLTAKVAGLVLYIVLGSLALKRAPTLRWKTVFFALAVLTYVWIVSVARLHHPLGFLIHFI